MSDETLQQLANQLRCPEDIDGVKLGHTMNMSNLSLILSGIHHLNIQPRDAILELGHGNAGHLAYLFSLADDIRYTGLEISRTMFNEAVNFNHAFCDAGLASFELYDGKHIAMRPNSFDKILSVNTLYFWDAPDQLLGSIAHVIKAGGLLVLTFCDKSFMQHLPFVKFGFHLYDLTDIEKLFANHPFQLIKQTQKQDKSISKTGKLVERIYHTLVYQKQ